MYALKNEYYGMFIIYQESGRHLGYKIKEGTHIQGHTKRWVPKSACLLKMCDLVILLVLP